MLKTIHASTTVEAPKEKVWDVLTGDESYRIWSSTFSEGSYVQTDWTVGSKIFFKDEDGSGLVGRIIEYVPLKTISIEYDGEIIDGKEEYGSDDAKAIKGAHEVYQLDEKDGVTRLTVECDMTEEYFDMMSQLWDKALEKIKQLSEGAV